MVILLFAASSAASFAQIVPSRRRSALCPYHRSARRSTSMQPGRGGRCRTRRSPA